MLQRSDKKIRIRIVDAGQTEVFEVEQTLNGVAGIKAKVDWLSETELNVAIVEYGSADVSDEYSHALASSGERELGVMLLEMNQESGRFVLVHTDKF